MVVHTYNPSTWQLEVEGSGVQFKVILSYIRIFKKREKYITKKSMR